MARRRSTTQQCAQCASNPITVDRFDSYGRAVHTVLADLAYNSAHYAYGRQDAITGILRDAKGNDVAALEGLRAYINGPLARARNSEGDRIQSVNGRRVRTAYIDRELALARSDEAREADMSGWLKRMSAEFSEEVSSAEPYENENGAGEQSESRK